MDCVDCPYGDKTKCPAEEGWGREIGCHKKSKQLTPTVPSKVYPDLYQYNETTKELNFETPSFARLVEYENLVYGDGISGDNDFVYRQKLYKSKTNRHPGHTAKKKK